MIISAPSCVPKREIELDNGSMEDAQKWVGGEVRRMVEIAGGKAGARAIGQLVFCNEVPASIIGIFFAFDSRILDVCYLGEVKK